MKKRGILIILFLFALVNLAQAQAVRLDYDDQSLNDVLLDLNERLKVQISIDSEIANRCGVTIHQRFSSMDAAMQALADYCELAYVKIDGVYSFYPKPEEAMPESPRPDRPKTRPQYLYQGVVVANYSDEPVPYALMQFGDRGIVADENGRFSFKSYRNPEQGLFRSLGYEVSDTTINPSASHKISLTQALYELEAIEIISDTLQLATHMGENAGHLRFNDISNNLVPGLSNNLIFNNLRLYPGVMAAGEAITDFVIWGSYAGQNYVTYDDITLFNSWGINDDMGRVNPYMIRNVEVYKGAFNVPYGDRIGGVVKMDGTSGNSNHSEFNLSLTNQLGNVYANLPVFGKATLQLAARKTLFESFDLSSGADQNQQLIVPTYDYTDYNLKFVAPIGETDQLTISSIYSEDSYDGRLQEEIRRRVIQDLKLNSTQSGASVKYEKRWPKGGISSVTSSYSRYDPTVTANYFLNFNQGPIGDTLFSYAWTNPIEETKVSVDHAFSATERYQAKVNLTHTYNDLSLKSTADERIIDDDSASVSRTSAFVLNDFQVTKDFSVQLGLKVDKVRGSGTYWQPRINARYDINHRWNVHAGWGMYNQYISKNIFVDELGNRSEVWQSADGIDRPVLSSTHGVFGLSYRTPGFEWGAEAFYKESEGWVRYTFNRNRDIVFRPVQASTSGLETYVKKTVGKHEFRGSYTLLDVEESLLDVSFNTARLAPQSQKHELKFIALLDLKPWQLSLSTVYGSGFPNRIIERDRAQFDIYRRTDLALQYSFSLNQTNVEAGLSILNVFDQSNIRLNQAVNTPTGGLLNTTGIPFTPTLYFNLKF